MLVRHDVRFDAYGAFAQDVALPQGEEDVTGTYRCRLVVDESGKRVQATQLIRCQVFRRDAFEASLRVEAEPVAPRSYRVELQATDYNGTPVAGGRAKVSFRSNVRPLDEAGQDPEGLRRETFTTRSSCLYHWERDLVLDAEGKANLSGHLDAYDNISWLEVNASIANDREEYVRLTERNIPLNPADFFMVVSGKRLYLRDARSPGNDEQHSILPREQKVQVIICAREQRRHRLPSGISYEVEEECELARHELTVPADCVQGTDLHALVQPFTAEKPHRAFRLIITGQDAAGRRIRMETPYYPQEWEREQRLLEPRGRSVCMTLGKPFEEDATLRAYISSQGRLRHTLVEARGGESSVLIPLQEEEYGQVSVTLVRCRRDAWGNCSDWSGIDATCRLPRPDKELTLTFTLPQGARPGQRVPLSGRVTDAEGRPARAAVTLFAVDAGMVSVHSYSLPELGTQFYLGRAPRFSLSRNRGSNAPCQPRFIPLPNVWSTAGADWGSASSPAAAHHRSVWPASLQTAALLSGPGCLSRMRMADILRVAQPDFRWAELIGKTSMVDDDESSTVFYSAAPAPVVPVKAARRVVGTGYAPGNEAGASGVVLSAEAEEEGECPAGYRARALARVDSLWDDELPNAARRPQPRLRTNFEPVALWLASLETAEDGSFCTDCTLPDTLTTYKVYAVALGAAGDSFGQATGEFLVNQELMLTAGTPFFMSCGDKMKLPLTITNNRETPGTWEVSLEGAGDVAPQRVELAGRGTATLFFEVEAREEGEHRLRWTARSAETADAVEGSFPVRYPAPLLREVHRLVLADGAAATQTATLLAPEVAQSTRGSLVLEYSTSPLIHLAGSIDFLLNYPYGCTEQRSSALMPWLFYKQLSPFCPHMAQTPADKVQELVERHIGLILARQQKDGGLSYWLTPRGECAESCPWASAYAGLVLTIAREQGFAVDAAALEKLQHYLNRQEWNKNDHLTQYAAARTCGRSGDINRILVRALRRELEAAEECGFRSMTADLEFIAGLRSNPGERHDALLRWLRSKGHDYRHHSSWRGGWTLIALSEYLRLEPPPATNASLRLNADALPVDNKPGRVSLKAGNGATLASLAPEIASAGSTVYVNLSVRAQPQQTEYPGVTEKGLQVTRLYETRGEDGLWKPATEFCVGDVVRVTLTCAKIADQLEYFVLEDYLPSNMEAINPDVPGQAAGLENGGRGNWSRWFDHREYLSDRVRGFCTRWWGRDVVNMSYYARVKRAGECTAPPAEAQLMYEPQTYGLSPNLRVRSK